MKKTELLACVSTLFYSATLCDKQGRGHSSYCTFAYSCTGQASMVHSSSSSRIVSGDKPLDRGCQMLTGVATYITGQVLPCALTIHPCARGTPIALWPFGAWVYFGRYTAQGPKTKHAKHFMLTLPTVPRHQNTPSTPRRQIVQNQTC